MSLPDLVVAKKTQRDKDWPMIRRLVESHFAAHKDNPTDDHLRFWLAKARTPEILLQLAAANSELVEAEIGHRPLLAWAQQSDLTALRRGLSEEQEAEREADARYWAPLKRELEQLRQRKQ